MMISSRRSRSAGIGPVSLALLFVLATLCATGCPPNPEFCCLAYERTMPSAAYCHNHSGAVGFYLETLDAAAERAWLDEFAEFIEQLADCDDPACITRKVNEQYAGTEFADFYAGEHEDAEREAARQPASSLDDRKKAALIICGFKDALERARETLEEE